MSVAAPERPASAATERAVAFVAARIDPAERLGAELAELSQDAEAFATRLATGFRSLADPEYEDGQHIVAPGLGQTYGVRRPLMSAVSRGFKAATRRDPLGPLLFVADRLLRDAYLEPRWFAFGLLERTLATETEQTWQLLRRASREARDWITVDDLAHPYARGIQEEPYRWAELELLVYSPSPWERRLVGSTIATMTHGARGKRLGPATVATALPIIEQLMGDAEPDVQKALAWAYRSLAGVDRDATTTALQAQAELSISTDDGHRAWVVRDTLAKLDPTVAAGLRERVAGIRRRPGAPSTSAAAATAARFGPLPDPRSHPEPPLG